MRPIASVPLLALLLSACFEKSVAPEDSGNGQETEETSETDSPMDTAPEDTAVEDTAPPQDLPPLAVVIGPEEVHLGDVVVLDGSGSSDPQGYSITAWDWACTDGTVATGPTLEVAFLETGDWTCSLTVTSASTLTGVASHPVRVLEKLPQWTLMVFLNGDNNLEASAIGDMNEMEVVGSTDEVQVVVQMDRARGGDSTNDNWTGARRFLVQADGNPRELGSATLEDLGAVDSGAADTIADFALWAMLNYPAEKYGLVFWDHGDGWSFTGDSTGTKDLSNDDDARSSLSVAEGELEQVLSDATGYLGRPLDLVGMDACLMGSWEIAWVVAPYADVYVASQASEGMDGWAWDTSLADLVADPTMDAATLGDSFARRFNETHDDTLSVTDLVHLSTLNDALDGLSTALMESENGAEILKDASNEALSFNWGGSDRDLGDLLDKMAAATDLEASLVTPIADARGALDTVVLANYTWGKDVEDAHGLTIYAPTRKLDNLYLEGSWADGSLWDDMLLWSIEGY